MNREQRYERPTVEAQNLSLQTGKLTAAGCEKIYKEKIFGAVGAGAWMLNS